VLKNDKMKA